MKTLLKPPAETLIGMLNSSGGYLPLGREPGVPECRFSVVRKADGLYVKTAQYLGDSLIGYVEIPWHLFWQSIDQFVNELHHVHETVSTNHRGNDVL